MIEIYADEKCINPVLPVHLRYERRNERKKHKDKTINYKETGTVHVQLTFKLASGGKETINFRGLRYVVLTNKKVFTYFPYRKMNETQFPIIDFENKKLFKEIRDFINADIAKNV